MPTISRLRSAALLGASVKSSATSSSFRPSVLHHRRFSDSPASPVAPRRTPGLNLGFSSTYDPSEDVVRGPIFDKPRFGSVPQFYPRDLKKLLDTYVIGQERAKRTTTSTVFNHHQRMHHKLRQEETDRLTREKLQRQRFARDRDLHDIHRESHNSNDAYELDERFELPEGGYRNYKPEPVGGLHIPEGPTRAEDVRIDKSNLLLIGPTGVGKTYILETLSKVLNIPFAICDCSSFTQAGYVGKDVETCIERLLIEANYDTRAAEFGIVILDEFDKIARKEEANNRDIGGEGVQQALLKLVEGTKVTVSIKDNHSSRSASPITSTYGSPNASLPPQGSSASGKIEQYTIDTSRILFVFSGAFVGLDKHIIRRVAKPSLGFGSELRSTKDSTIAGSKAVLPAKMYAHLPHQPADDDPNGANFTPLDLVSPADLQAFGFIPELIGRLHNICALTPLSVDELYRILTEPRHSLIAQYTALFETYPSRLYFTQRALHAIAERASKVDTGARGLKMELERVLAEPMFDAPMAYVLITEGCVNGTDKAGYWGKDGLFEVQRRIRDEDEGLGRDAAVLTELPHEQPRQAGQSGV
ncbi:ATPase AAA-2 [Grosmannia clavigera kw1407]|uniref:ATPase AAA-2 n=1 Tax=Grosmannia clavigera (strain kw1407 / UAMH 11150) TaxID=655863 RepID=F0XTE9_GROCL|nr:ATPase AAA-2 [Grosmannia clavigera kw1407]EFW98802.1 ATPase AAA-2 [Grosmannia clavigera kw1407]